MRFPKNIIGSPEQYAEAAVLAREAANEMLSRLEWMTIKPAMILDAGCGLGELASKLQSRFPEAQVLALDVSLPMLQAVMQTSVTRICAEGETLPLRDQSIDLICANLLLPWCDDVSLMLREWRRVLRPNGLVMLTALGPDTLREWRDVFNAEQMPTIMDMHDLGDGLVQAGFVDPVLDVDHVTLAYQSLSQLIAELQVTGMLSSEVQASSLPDNRELDVTAELVYAHAWAPEVSDEYAASSDGEVRIPLSRLRASLRGK